ncbi:MAG: hypothetical protein NVSMB3_12260 [Acidobacteriaceae bacterium]
MATAVVFDRQYAGVSLFTLSNLVGGTTASLLQGRGLTACTMLMGTPGNPICFHGGRMPVPTLVVALCVWLLGDHFVRVGLLKAVLLLLPMEIAIFLACRGLLAEGRGRQWLAGCLLLAPFGMTSFLADVVNLQVEEGYTYAFMALAVAILLFRTGRSGWLRKDGWGEAAVFGVAVAGLYLSKSSMAAAAAVLTIGYVRRARGNGVRVLAAGLALAAPVGWALYQHHATGRYSLGTSLDGFNLRKGNDASFLARYPPPAGGTLDEFDNELNAGVVFPDEWRFNDFHERAAVAFMHLHPGATARGEVRKLELILFSVRKYGSGESQGLLLGLELTGMVVFRLIFWTVMGVCVIAVVRDWQGFREDGAIFLLLVSAVALPYVVGFGYTRHVSVLIYPSVLMGCRLLGLSRTGTGELEGLH